MSLREKKKKSTRRSILAAARSLFFTGGYEATSMGMIAEESGVAVGTIYNYFSSKAHVMVEINREDTDSVMVHPDGADLAGCSVEDLIWGFLEGLLNYLSIYPRELIREVFFAVWKSHRGSLAEGLLRQDERILSHLAGFFSRLKESGRIKPDAEPETIAFAVYGMISGAMMLYAVDDSVSVEDTKVRIAAMTGQFCRGIVPEGSK